MALAHTPNLVTLNFTVPSEYGAALVSKMHRRGIICNRGDFVRKETVLVISDPLPNLAHLRISGDTYLVELATFRKLTTLQIEDVDTLDGFQIMIECLTDEFPVNISSTNASLINLTLGLSSDNPIEITECLHAIGKMLSLEYLSIYTNDVNALVSYLFSSQKSN